MPADSLRTCESRTWTWERKPVSIFCDDMKRSQSKTLELSAGIISSRNGILKGSSTANSKESLSLLQQLVSFKIGASAGDSDFNILDSIRTSITGTRGTRTSLATRPRRMSISALQVSRDSPPMSQRRRMSAQAQRPTTWGPQMQNSGSDNGSDSNSDGMKPSPRFSRTSKKAKIGAMSPNLAFKPQPTAQLQLIEHKPEIFDIAEIPTPPYMSPEEIMDSDFVQRLHNSDNCNTKNNKEEQSTVSCNTKGLQVVVAIEDENKTEIEILSGEGNETEKEKAKEAKPEMITSKKQLCFPDLKRVNNLKRASQTNMVIKGEGGTISWTKLLCLLPAYDGKGCELNMAHFNATDFQNVNFAHNGFHPRSYFVSCWEFLISLMFLIFGWVIPFIASYSKDFPITSITNLYAWSLLISFVYFVDAVISALTPQPNLTNELCNLLEYESLRPTLPTWLNMYAFRKLPIDVLTIIPIDLFLISWERASTILILRCLRFYRLFNILARNPYYKKLQRATDKAAGLPICNIIPIAIGIFFFLHVNACTIYYFGSMKGFVGWSAVWPQIENEPALFEFYSWTFYQAVGNMFPINFTPQTELEQIVAAVFIVSAAILYGAFLGSISSTTMSINPSGRLYNQKMEELNDYVKWKNLNPETEKKLFSYYEIKYRGKYFEEDALLAEMNDSLREEIVLHNTRWLIEKVAFLRRVENDGRDEIFFTLIAKKLHANYFTPGDFITKQGESAADMYFIVSGKCDVFVGGKKVVSLYDGAYFGEVALICKVLRTASVRAVMHSVLYRLTYADFHDILNQFDDMKMRIAALAEERENAVRPSLPPPPPPPSPLVPVAPQVEVKDDQGEVVNSLVD